MSIEMKDMFTKQELLDVVSERIVEKYSDIFYNEINKKVMLKVDKIINEKLKASIDKKIDEEMEKAFTEEFFINDAWGKLIRKTTLREEIHKRSVEYWEVMIDKDMKKCSKYNHGARPRYEVVMQTVMENSFKKRVNLMSNELSITLQECFKKNLTDAVNGEIRRIFKNPKLK